MITGFTLVSLHTRMHCTHNEYSIVLFFFAFLPLLSYHLLVLFFPFVLWSLSSAHTHSHTYFDGAFVREMLHVIVHSSLNVSGEQLTDLLFAFHFAFILFFLLCFRFFPISIACACVCCVFFSCPLHRSLARATGFMRILFYLHYMIFFIFYVALSFHSSCFFFATQPFTYSRSLARSLLLSTTKRVVCFFMVLNS